MSIEYGIFTGEGCIESGFYSRDEAQACIVQNYPEEDDARVAEICPEHPEQERHNCEDCNAEDSEDE